MRNFRLDASLWLGVEFFAWLRVLARNRFAIHPARLPRAAGITLAAPVNTTLRAVQAAVYGGRVRRVVVPDDPVFVLGHWRTGTTMLHELLALDPAHRAPTTYESLAPNHFLLSERVARRFAHVLMPRTRPFDNMRMSFDRPQEDEAALALRGSPSPFMQVAFPRRATPWPGYVDLEPLTPRQLARWERDFRKYLQLLLYRRAGRPVLKSPQHTNRVPALLAMFPQARFVHVVRDPFVVFPSTVHFWRTMYQRYGLQRVDESRLREQVFADFAHMHERFETARPLIPAGRLHEVRYESLVADPVAEVARIYEFLGADFAPARAAVEQYAARSERYKTNEYALDAATRAEISRRWRGYFDRHGYDAGAD